jgi:hypothetical protein
MNRTNSLFQGKLNFVSTLTSSPKAQLRHNSLFPCWTASNLHRKLII